jgi:hypothetical protein
LKEEITVKGMRLFGRCWRTPTGDTPYMIWTIGSRDAAPAGQNWIIRGESVAFQNLPIQPTDGFVKSVIVSSPDDVAGPMVEQPGGDKAEVAFIRGRLQRIETLVETIPLPDTTLVKASRGLGEDFGTMYHFIIPKPLRFTTASGLTIDIPMQGADTKMTYGAASGQPMAALFFRPNFKESEEKLEKSTLWKKYGGPVDIDVRLKGIHDDYSHGFIGKDYVVEAKGIGLKAEPVTGVSLEITQTAVLESYPLEFKVAVKDSKAGL